MPLELGLHSNRKRLPLHFPPKEHAATERKLKKKSHTTTSCNTAATLSTSYIERKLEIYCNFKKNIKD